MNVLPLIFITLITFVPISLIFTLIPYLTRRTESFGISMTVEAHAHPINQRMRKQYAVMMGLLSTLITLSITILVVIMDTQAWANTLIIHLFVIIIGSFLIYLKFHFQTKRLKQEHGWSGPEQLQRVVVDTSFRNQKVVHSAWWFLPQGIMMLLTVLTGVLLYDRFPDIIPMQYDMAGTITRTVDKTYQAVLWPVSVQATMLMAMVFAHVAIMRSKQQIDAANPEISLKRNVIFRRRWSAFMFVFGFLLSALFYFIQLSMLFDMDPLWLTVVIVSFTGVLLAYAIWLSIRTGQGGSRIKIDGQEASTVASGQTNTDDDRYWKLGQIYFNPNDPAYFVEKRFGVGWTINMARPLAWIILLALIGIPLILTIIFVP